MPSDRKVQVFIIEAESNDEVTEIIESLPMMLFHNWTVKSLETWEHHKTYVNTLD